MSATSMGDRTSVQQVIRRVPCPRCKAQPAAACVSGTQYGGKYPKRVPDSHVQRWKAAVDAGHLPDDFTALYR